MFITEEQLKERLKNPRNLANRFKNGREVRFMNSEGSEGNNYAANDQSGSPEPEKTTESSGIGSEESQCIQEQDGQKIYESSIQHREIKRPGNNRPWLSQQERTRIAADYTSATGDNFKTRTKTEIAEKYGVRVSTVSDITNGTRRVEDSPRSVDKKIIDEQLDEVREKAIERLMAGLGQLTEDKVSAHNAKDISVICANMARVVQQTIPQEKAAQQINLVVYTPELRTEKSFEVVEV